MGACAFIGIGPSFLPPIFSFLTYAIFNPVLYSDLMKMIF